MPDTSPRTTRRAHPSWFDSTCPAGRRHLWLAFRSYPATRRQCPDSCVVCCHRMVIEEQVNARRPVIPADHGSNFHVRDTTAAHAPVQGKISFSTIKAHWCTRNRCRGLQRRGQSRHHESLNQTRLHHRRSHTWHREKSNWFRCKEGADPKNDDPQDPPSDTDDATWGPDVHRIDHAFLVFFTTFPRGRWALKPVNTREKVMMTFVY